MRLFRPFLKRLPHAVCRLLCLILCTLLCPAAEAWSLQRSEVPVPQLVSIHSVLDGESGKGEEPVLLRGTITYARSRVVLQDQTGAIELALPSQERPSIVGDEIEAQGYLLAAREGGRRFAVQSTQTLWHSSPPLPLAITPDRAADGRYDLHFVQTTGLLTHVDKGNRELVLSLQGDHQFFTARIDEPLGESSSPSGGDNLEIGSTLRLSGVLLASPRLYSSADGSFVMLVHSPDDLEVVHGPNWWNVRHISYLFAAALLVAAVLQVVHLQQVKRRYGAVLAERARIARDIHDTLAQGFAGIALQLEVVHAKLARNESAEQHLTLALRMVQHSRAEAHRSIAALRAFSREMPLQTMLEEMIRHLQDVPGQQVLLHFSGGVDVLLPPWIAENVYRIAQELLSNAQQHASASTVCLAIAADRGVLSVSVQDDGIGMDPELLNLPPAGHYGLLGLRERVHTLRGQVSIVRLAPGTRVTVAIPVPNRRSSRRDGVPLSHGMNSSSRVSP